MRPRCPKVHHVFEGDLRRAAHDCALRQAALQREGPVNPERSHRCMAAALEAAQLSFESAGDRPTADSRRTQRACRRAVGGPQCY